MEYKQCSNVGGLTRKDYDLLNNHRLKTLEVDFTDTDSFEEAVCKALSITDISQARGFKRLNAYGLLKNVTLGNQLQSFVENNPLQVMDFSQASFVCNHWSCDVVWGIRHFFQKDGYGNWKKCNNGICRTDLQLVLLPKPSFPPVIYNFPKRKGYCFFVDPRGFARFAKVVDGAIYYGDVSVPECLEIKGMTIEPDIHYNSLMSSFDGSSSFICKIQSVKLFAPTDSPFLREAQIENLYVDFEEFGDRNGDYVPHWSSGGLKGWDVKNLRISGKMKHLPEEVFRYMERLETVVFEEGVEVIDSNAFHGNPKLKKIVLPKSVKTYSGLWTDKVWPEIEKSDS